jgi:hypothetical protein
MPEWARIRAESPLDGAKELIAVRDRLLTTLEQRLAADSAAGSMQEYLLRLAEGADGEDMNLVLRRAGTG